MDKKVIGLLGGAISALALFGSAQAQAAPAAGVTQALAASSFEDLLQPLPNASAVLQALDEADANGLQGRPVGGALMQVRDHHHHHHHHHHRRNRRVRHHHHHHHHVVIMRRHHHHHHHHHHNLLRDLFPH